MLRVIFDTNIYGNLVREEKFLDIGNLVAKDSNFIVYGYPLVRKELRKVSKKTKESRRTRILLLNLYDQIIGKHFLKHSLTIYNLAEKYYNYYKKLGGFYNWRALKFDLMIVACASFYDLDIVFSSDNKTMFSKKAMKSYKHINLKENYPTPSFLNYQEIMDKYKN